MPMEITAFDDPLTSGPDLQSQLITLRQDSGATCKAEKPELRQILFDSPINFQMS